MRIILPIIVSTLLITGCDKKEESPQLPPVDSQQLLHHNFVLIGYDSKSYEPQQMTPNLEFGENLHISGSMCNNFSGQGELHNGVLTVNGLASTEKLCAADELNQLDQIISQTLIQGATLTLDNTTLTLTTPEHTLTYTLRDWLR